VQLNMGRLVNSDSAIANVKYLRDTKRYRRSQQAIDPGLNRTLYRLKYPDLFGSCD